VPETEEYLPPSQLLVVPFPGSGNKILTPVPVQPQKFRSREKNLAATLDPVTVIAKTNFLQQTIWLIFLNPLSRIQAKIRPHFLIWSLSRPLAFL
jgi:hypothetical protein